MGEVQINVELPPCNPTLVGWACCFPTCVVEKEGRGKREREFGDFCHIGIRAEPVSLSLSGQENFYLVFVKVFAFFLAIHFLGGVNTVCLKKPC